jgi:hypothetical protein
MLARDTRRRRTVAAREKNKIKFSTRGARCSGNRIASMENSRARRRFVVKPRRRGAFFPTNSSRKSGLSETTRRA